jgi:hypothetical protein
MPDNKPYCKTSPCKNCPYRKDAPLRYWSIEEFIDLLEKEGDYMGSVYACHKKDETVCTGWLMNQDKRGFPSIALRLSLSRNKVTREFLDSLKCKSEMFDTVEEMCHENYPELKRIKPYSK